MEYPKLEIYNAQAEMPLDELLGKENIERILSITDVAVKEREIAFGKDRAREFNQVTSYNNLLKAMQQEMATKELANIGSYQTNFTDIETNYSTGDFIADDKGIYKISMGSDFEQKKEIVCPHPIYIESFLQNVDTELEKAKLKFYKNGKWQTLVVNKSQISDRNSIVGLSNFGIEVNSGTATLLIEYLATLTYENMGTIPYYKSTTKMGWKEDKSFMPYDKTLVFDGEQDFADIYGSIKEKGDFETWKEETKTVIEYNPINQLILASSFAAPLVSLLGTNPFIVHLWGGSGTGKTVAQMMASSVWGDPEIGRYTRSLNSTQVGFEYTAEFLNHLPLICDELQLITRTYQYKDNFDSLIMNLCSGIGRGRGRKDGGIQEMTTWKNCFIFSGEEPIIQSSSGGGAANRVIEIQMKDKLISNGHYTSNLYRRNYGMAGRKFIEILQSEDIEEMLKVYGATSKELEDLTTSKQSQAMAIILISDALISKHLLQTKRLTKDFVAQFLFDESVALPYERAYEYIKGIVAQNINKFEIDSEDYESKKPLNEVWGRINDNDCYVIRTVLEDKLKEKGYSFAALADNWADKNYLIRDNAGKNTRTVRIMSKPTRAVHLNIQEEALPEEESGEVKPLSEQINPFVTPGNTK